MVLQDTWLFKGSIMENIRYGKLDAGDEDVIKAAKAAHVDDFVKHLPDGYNMVLNEEASNVLLCVLFLKKLGKLHRNCNFPLC